MSPEQWAEERRDAMASLTEMERVTSCDHRHLNRAGDCVDCPAVWSQIG